MNILILQGPNLNLLGLKSAQIKKRLTLDKLNKKIKAEKLYRKDKIYDIVIVINYNTRKIIKNKGSAIFIHVTKNYRPTKGCIALCLRDLEILLKVIKKNSKIKIS